MANLLIVSSVRTIILHNRKWIWITFSNLSIIHVESFQKFKNMQKLFHSNIQIFKNTKQKKSLFWTLPAHFWAFSPGPDHGPGLKACFCRAAEPPPSPPP
jgi:hypothetical protein